MPTSNFLVCLVAIVSTGAFGGQASTKNTLEGKWHAKSMVRGDVTMPSQAVERVWFTFHGATLTLSNFPTKGERTCSIQVDTKPLPKHLDCSFDDGTKLLMAWERDGQRLTVAVPRADVPLQRPTSLKTDTESKVLVAVFEAEPDK